MRRFRDLPIGRKLVAIGVAASALALVVSGTIFLVSTVVALRNSVRTEIEAQSQIIADNTAAALAFLDQAAATETIAALRATEDVDMACLFAEDGKLFASYPTSVCPATAPTAASRLGGIVISRAVTAHGNRYGTLLLEGNYSQVWGRLAAQSVAALIGIALGVGAAVLLARIQRVISRPIVELSSTAARISQAGDYSLRATRQGDDEIGELVETFNAMLAEVERRDEQLRAASRLKDEFLATLSHELRTPLNAVLGWIQVLRSSSLDPTLVARAYASIERNARAQTTLIEDLLDVSRIVTGKLHLTSEAVDLVAVIDAALEVVRAAGEAKSLTITRQILPSPQWVYGDLNRLQQIAWNVLSNAVKFTGTGGHIRVVLRTEPSAYVLDVEDDGIGLDAAFLPHVFDRFRQADGSMSRPHGGLGLGLAIARELAELHGGSVSASSPGLGGGATFTITLPRPAVVPLVTAGHRGGDTIRLDGATVLVVDDDEDARDVAHAIVTEAGGAVRPASTADEALEILGSQHVDVILCDLAMPGVDGYELLRRLRTGAASTRRPDVPAVAVSAYAGAAVEHRARAAGFDGFLAKPYKVAGLLAALHDALGARAS